MKTSVFGILLIFLIQACNPPSAETPAFVPTSALEEHTEIFQKRIEKAGDHIYVAIGYGLANSILIEGKDSCVLIDCMESMEAGQEVKNAFNQICPKPVKAIIYTHFHTDHTSGALALAGNAQPDVYAQELLPHYLDQTSAVVRNIIEKRSYRMFGVFLDSNGLVNCGIGPRLRIQKGSQLGVIRPTITFRDSLEVTIAGIPLKLYHAPGETPDQLMVWLPESKTLFCGDNLYKTFPNLYTIRGTGYRDVNLWKNSLDHMRYLHPEVIVPSHTEIVRGADRAYALLTDYRDAIQFVHDQTVYGMNRGLTPDELAEQIVLPEHLQKNPWLKEFYGKVSWSVRSIFDGYLGFFNGDPATLLPLSLKERAEKMIQLAGGKNKFAGQIEKAAGEKQAQWVLELASHYLLLYPEDSRIKKLKTEALLALGNAQSNPNARHYYLTCALEMEGLSNQGLVQPSSAFVKDIPLASVFNGMAAHLNAEKSKTVRQKVLFRFTDTQKVWTVEIRNGVAEVQPFDTGNPELTIQVKEQVWKELAAKIRKPVKTFLDGEIKINGGQLAFIRFMRLFDIEEE